MSRAVLFFNPARNQLRDLQRMLATVNCGVETPSDLRSFELAVARGAFDILVYAAEYHPNVQRYASESLSKKPCILLVNHDYRQLTELLPKIAATHIIARSSDHSVKLRDLTSVIRKLVDEEDIFGIEHYLAFGTNSEVFHVRDSSERHEYIDALVDFCRRLHLRQTTIQSVELFCEELLMNAIYDAPRDEQGQALYNHLSRRNRVILKPKQAARIEFACDGEKLVVSVSDPFGAITWATIQKFLAHCFRSENKVQNLSEDGGAGLGLYLCFASAQSFVVNVDPARRSEFIGIFDVAESPRLRQSRYSNLHFFSTDRAQLVSVPVLPQRRSLAG